MTLKIKLLSGTSIREGDEYDALTQIAIDRCVRDGLLETLGLNSDGQMVYRRTTKERTPR
jgi:hypothetical protein